MQKILLGVILSGLLLSSSIWLAKHAAYQATYQGLPTVACIDPTLPFRQSFSFHIDISISGKNYPLDPTIGHDFGKCLHEIYVLDRSGKVYVKANDTETYTLGEFFDVWRKTFSSRQIMSYIVDNTHQITVTVNGGKVGTYRETSLLPNERITVAYN